MPNKKMPEIPTPPPCREIKEGSLLIPIFILLLFIVMVGYPFYKLLMEAAR